MKSRRIRLTPMQGHMLWMLESIGAHSLLTVINTLWALYRHCWEKRRVTQWMARAAKWEVRVAARAVPVHQASSRWRLMPTAIATCSRRTFGNVR
jgi:hypothetical protein